METTIKNRLVGQRYLECSNDILECIMSPIFSDIGEKIYVCGSCIGILKEFIQSNRTFYLILR